MNDRNYPGGKASGDSGARAADPATDPAEGAVASFLDFLEGLAPRPALDDLADDDRRRAVAMINSLLTGRGIELDASTPSVEALLAGTDLEPLLESSTGAGSTGGGSQAPLPLPVLGIDRERARAERIEAAVRGADRRVQARAEPHRLLGPAVAVVYLDLRAVFYPVSGSSLMVTDDVRDVLSHVLSDDTDLDYVGMVACDSSDLLTQLVSASDLGRSSVTPSDDWQLAWFSQLPLPLALRAMLELAAPAWEPFTFDASISEPLRLADIAADATRRVLAREVSRPYRGDKGRAYKSFDGSAATFTSLTVRLAAPDGMSDEAIADELDRIARDAA
jgi:hypothetical protein